MKFRKLALDLLAIVAFSLIAISLAVAGIFGDIDNDGSGPNLSHLIFMANHVLLKGPQPSHIHAANVNGTGGAALDFADLSCFMGGAFPT